MWIIGQLPASDAISCNEIKSCFSEKIDCLRNNNSIRQKRLQINSQIIRITQKMVDIAKVTSLENYPQMIRYIYISYMMNFLYIKFSTKPIVFLLVINL